MYRYQGFRESHKAWDSGASGGGGAPRGAVRFGRDHAQGASEQLGMPPGASLKPAHNRPTALQGAWIQGLRPTPSSVEK